MYHTGPPREQLSYPFSIRKGSMVGGWIHPMECCHRRRVVSFYFSSVKVLPSTNHRLDCGAIDRLERDSAGSDGGPGGVEEHCLCCCFVPRAGCGIEEYRPTTGVLMTYLEGVRGCSGRSQLNGGPSGQYYLVVGG